MPLDAVPFELAGTWALETVITSTSKAPLIGEVRSASRSRLLVTVTPNGAGWTQRQQVCTSVMEGGSKLARTVLPAAWVSTMPARSYDVTLAADASGWLYNADTGLQLIGYDGARGPMPARGDAPNVVDSDRDGHPGATVRVEVPGFGAGEIYLAHRGHSRLVGRPVTADRIEGSVVVLEMSQATLGASHKVFDFSPETRPDPARSTFAMWRVTPGADCTAL